MSKFPAVFVFVLFCSILVNTEMGLDHCRPRVANERASEHATFQISNCERPFSGGPSFPLWLGLVETAAIVQAGNVCGWECPRISGRGRTFAFSLENGLRRFISSFPCLGEQQTARSNAFHDEALFSRFWSLFVTPQTLFKS